MLGTSDPVPGTWYQVLGTWCLVPEHLFGKSEHLFGVSERLIVFGEHSSGSALLEGQRPRPSAARGHVLPHQESSGQACLDRTLQLFFKLVPDNK